MIQTITVINYLGDSIDLELANPEPSGIIVANVEGLGPVQTNINTTDLATADGAIFSSARVQTRNIVLSLIFKENPTIEYTRHITYKYFPIKRKVTLRVTTTERTVEATGYVESNTPTIFSKEEYTQVSIVCPDPYFYATSVGKKVFAGVEPLFEFPFSNPVRTRSIIMGEIVTDTRAILYYDGDVETGVRITISARDVAQGIVIYNTKTYESMKIDDEKIRAITGSGFHAGDDILISTVNGDKYCRLYRDGQFTNIISAINKDADWFQLTNGDNIFAFTAEAGDYDIVMTFEYRIAYGGI